MEKKLKETQQGIKQCNDVRNAFMKCKAQMDEILKKKDEEKKDDEKKETETEKKEEKKVDKEINDLRSKWAFEYDKHAVERVRLEGEEGEPVVCSKAELLWWITQPLSDRADTERIKDILDELKNLKIAYNGICYTACKIEIFLFYNLS